MRNLIVETQSTTSFKDNAYKLQPTNCHCCYDFDNNIYYVVDNGPHGNRIHIIDIANDTYTVKGIMRKIPKQHAIGIEYCSISKEIFVGYDCGVVFQLKEFTEELYDVMEVAEFTTGLCCMKLSPDEDAIAFVTKDLVVNVITCKYFDLVNSSNLLSAEFGEKEFVSVGWGKKETQFHGSAGKSAATATTTAFRSDMDNGLPKITWNSLSTLFAVSFIDSNANARRFKVYNRKGILLYTSELINGLEGTLAWKTSDNLIASTRKLPHKHTVTLFDKNGLLLREFTLPFASQKIQILNLIWSTDSDILGIWYKNLTTGLTIVQLWSQCNYNWYLKQTIKYPEKYPILYVDWYPQTDKDLLILSTMCSTTYTFYWGVSHSYGKNESDKAVVSVINGDQVYITKFKYSIIPPPMCQQKLDFKETVNAVLFAPNDSDNPEYNSNDFLALMSNNKIVLCKDKTDDLHTQYIHKTYNLSLWIENVYEYTFNLMQHLFWYKEDVILFSITLGAKSSLYQLPLLRIDALDEILVEARLIQKMPGKIQHIVASSNSKAAYVIVNNQVYRYNDRDGLVKSEITIGDEKSSRTLVKVESVNFGDKEVIIALTRNHILFANGKEIINNVTSFFVHSEALLITTQQHTLICFDLSSTGLDQLTTQDLTIQPWVNKSNVEELSVRRVESGSSLITVVAKSDRVILQMPRGNIEAIQHRALTIDIIKPLLDKRNYKEALQIMRRQRIDYNLFYDHDPQSFLNSVEKFVDDLDASNLTTFLTDLHDGDITRSIYKSSYSNRTKSKAAKQDKVELICGILRTRMEKNPNDLIEPIIVSLVKSKNPRCIEEALRKLQRLGQSEERSCVQARLRHMDCTMSKRSNLFDVALGTYDLELAMFVAEAYSVNSRENVDFLNGFKELEGDYRRYRIDMHLKRYASALANIAKLPGKFHECTKLIRERELYAQGLKLFAGRRAEYAEIATTCAEVLNAKGKHREAGILYTKANELNKALAAYKKANCWRDAIATAFKLKLSLPELNSLYRESVERLQKESKYSEAAIILSKYLNKLEEAVEMLCMAKDWLQAWHEACCINRLDLIESRVRPSVVEHADFLLGHLRHCREDFVAHRSRLAEVRPELGERRRVLAELGNPVGEVAGESLVEDPEVRSVANSMETGLSLATSCRTNRTYRSSKNRRKHERKMCSIKKGSLYEDIGLVKALHQLVTQVYQQRDDVRSVSEMLLYINSDELAEELQKEMGALLDEISKCKHEIWPPNRDNIAEDGWASEMQMWREPHLLYPPEEKSINWRLDMFSHS